MKSTSRCFCLLALVSVLAAPAAFAGDIDGARNLVNKGNFQMASGHFNDALKSYEDASKLEPGNAVIKDNIAKVYNNWACWYTKQKKYHEALEKLQKCLELSPGYGQARNNMALLRRHASDDGVDLDAPPDQERQDIPIPPQVGGTKVPKVLSNEAASGASLIIGGVKPAQANPTQQSGGVIKTQTPKFAPNEPEAGAFLIIGGVKQPQSNPMASPTVDSYPVGATSAPPSPPGEPVASTSSGAMLVSPVESSASTWSAKPVNPLFPVTPNQFPQQSTGAAPQQPSTYTQQPTAQQSQPSIYSQQPSAVTTQQPSAVTTQQPSIYSQQPPVTTNQAVPTLDEQLTSVEMKVYGTKQGALTILQRLEKIERDSAGQVRAGTIVERIDYLKKSFGLQ